MRTMWKLIRKRYKTLSNLKCPTPTSPGWLRTSSFDSLKSNPVSAILPKAHSSTPGSLVRTKGQFLWVCLTRSIILSTSRSWRGRWCSYTFYQWSRVRTNKEFKKKRTRLRLLRQHLQRRVERASYIQEELLAKAMQRTSSWRLRIATG